MVNKKILDNKKVLCAILVLAGTISAFAFEIKGEAPTFTGPLATEFNKAVGDAFGEAKGKLKDMAEGIGNVPKPFIQSWGNSGVFASHGATQRAYGDYKLFAFTLGPMLGLQLPGDPFAIMGDMGDLTSKLKENSEIKLGLNPQILSFRIGVNASKFLLDKLYLGLHFGAITLDNFMDGFSFNTFSLGATANYQLIPQLNLGGVLLWRGLNVGSGLIYQGTTIEYTIKLGSITEDLNVSVVEGITAQIGNFSIDPKIFLKMETNTVTIPLEATTAVRLLWFLNIPLGVGVDLGFGKSDLKVGINADINVDPDPTYAGLQEDKAGYISASTGGYTSPSFFNLKFMTGLGFNFGPAVLDIPVTFYMDKGYSIGITVGVVF
jgi:hypothetical protein